MENPRPEFQQRKPSAVSGEGNFQEKSFPPPPNRAGGKKKQKTQLAVGSVRLEAWNRVLVNSTVKREGPETHVSQLPSHVKNGYVFLLRASP